MARLTKSTEESNGTLENHCAREACSRIRLSRWISGHVMQRKHGKRWRSQTARRRGDISKSTLSKMVERIRQAQRKHQDRLPVDRLGRRHQANPGAHG